MFNPLRSLKLSLRQKFFLSIVFIVVPVMGVIFAWVSMRTQENATAQVINQARVLSRQIVLTRQWVADCGGIMVAKASQGAGNGAYFYNDTMETGRGTYQRYTPSMVTKALSSYSLRENLYKFRIASMNPMNPENRPNHFESAALYHFIHESKTEFYNFSSGEKGQSFHYSVPLYVDKACLDCHREQGFTEGTVGGCLSFSFPMDELRENLKSDYTSLLAGGIGLISLTIVTLFFMLRFVVIRPLQQLETMAGEISQGNLEARVSLDSNDEFAHLGSAFNQMGEKLSRSHHDLEERIARATREIYQANQELQQLDQLKSEFFADMSHELRSPLTAIKGGVSYLKRTIDGEDSQNYLNIIEKNADRMMILVSDLFDLTKIDAGKLVWQFEECDIPSLVQEVIEIVRIQAESRNIRIEFTSRQPLVMNMDPERIEQVLVNLIENALKFSEVGSRVDIEAGEDSQNAWVSVKDQGAGIAEEDLDKIFRKFHTLPSAGGSGPKGGTGLGLTICRKIIEAHGGKIWVESQPGAGSTFTFTLPKRSAQ